MARKFLDQDGLLYLWGKITAKFQPKETGKGLSTNDYTTAEKNKLSGIETGANKTTIVDNLTSTSTTSALSAAQGKILDEKITDINGSLSSLGYGDMLKSVYDTNNDGVVDKAENATKFNGQTADYYAKAADIPTVTNDYTDTEKQKVSTAYTHSQSAHAPSNAQANIIESVLVNGAEQSITQKTVDITVPTKVSDLTNDSGYLTEHQDISGKADKSTTLAGYGIGNAYTKTETDTAIETAKQEAINTILGSEVDTDFDTLQEVAAWIQSDTTNSTALINRVSAIEADYVKDSELVAITNAEIDAIIAA